MKNWKDISDNEFDELFKKSSQLAKPQLKDSYWLEFEKRLEDPNLEKKVSYINNRNFLALLAILLIAGLVGTKNYLNNKDAIQNGSDLSLIDKEINVQTSRKQNWVKGKKQLSELQKLSKTNHHEIEEGLQVETNKNLNISDKGEVRNTNNGTTSYILEKKSKALKKFESANSFNHKNQPLNNKSHSLSRNVNSSLNVLKQAEFEIRNENNVSKRVEVDLGSKTFSVGYPSKIKGTELIPFLENSKFSHTPIDYHRVNNKLDISKDRKFENKIYLTVGVSPDFSKVLDNSFLKMGYNWSTQLEYHLDERWSLQSGVILSEKHYSSTPSGISWPTRWGTVPKELKGMEGSCKVVDIPLNIRYNIKYNDIAKMYIVGGVSSFILLDESYQYLYPEGFTFQGIKTKWARKEKEFLAAGMANFAIGYERKLGNVFSIQIEPFVKIPTRDFGFTQVKLASTGVFVVAKARLK